MTITEMAKNKNRQVGWKMRFVARCGMCGGELPDHHMEGCFGDDKVFRAVIKATIPRFSDGTKKTQMPDVKTPLFIRRFLEKVYGKPA
ncbi:hypothetical protein LCGC14_1143810 [marine sediment metagenome]|uniref:Uncharacterized protein n=1 Tax=marine sediment metagenome TaxID=412755 RepID=A0A0F9M2D2_9ZZZZ